MNKILFSKPTYKLKKDYYEKLIKYAFSIEHSKNKTKKDKEMYDYILPILIKLAKMYNKYARVIYQEYKKEFIFLFKDSQEDKEGFALHVKYVERKAILNGKKICVPCYKTKQDYWFDSTMKFKKLDKEDNL